ncbi:MAG: FAD:protein FMN transferase [Clostridia bacterium]|nr:FAD:protein FMN transferase [Clostridia bacterium]
MNNKSSHAPLLSLVLCLSMLLSMLVGCGKQDPPMQAKKVSENYFNTASVVYSYAGDDEAVFLDNFKLVEGMLKEYHQLFDIYYEYKGENTETINNIKTINKNAGVSPVKVDRRIIDLLLFCKEIYALTDGKTNIAQGAMLKLWHDERENALDNPTSPELWRLPDRDALIEASSHACMDNLIIDEAEGTVYISDPKMQLDVGAVAKGYATERIAEELIKKGVTSYVLNIGGNIRILGSKPSGEHHQIHIRNPKDPYSKNYSYSTTASDTSVVTSGNYERYYLVDGERYHHIIDQDTLYPSEYFDSVSIFTKDSGLADALSTALFCMSEQDGRALISSLDCKVEVIWIYPDGRVSKTDGV